jgi:hypothetical protein
MKNLLLILVLSLFSIQSFAGSCPDGSEPVKSISADGTYFVFNCGGSNEQASSSSSNTKALAGIDIENDSNIDFFTPPQMPTILDNKFYAGGLSWQMADFNNDGYSDVLYIGAVDPDNINEIGEDSGGTCGGNTCKGDNPLPALFLGGIDKRLKYSPELIIDNRKDMGMSAGRQILVADYNDDSTLDFYVADHGLGTYNGYRDSYFLSQPNGTWLESSETHLSHSNFVVFDHGGATGDIDNDGDMDIVITSLPTEFWCLMNDGAGFLTKRKCGGSFAFALELADMDNDGDLDAIVGGHESNAMVTGIFWNDGKGIFSEHNATSLPQHKNKWSTIPEVSASDLDNDGDLDIVYSRAGKLYVGTAIQIIENLGNKKFKDHGIFPLVEAPDDYVPVHEGNEWNDFINAIQFRDLDKDGDNDIYLMASVSTKTNGMVLLNHSDFSFELKQPSTNTYHSNLFRNLLLAQSEIRFEGKDLFTTFDSPIHLDTSGAQLLGFHDLENTFTRNGNPIVKIRLHFKFGGQDVSTDMEIQWHPKPQYMAARFSFGPDDWGGVKKIQKFGNNGKFIGIPEVKDDQKYAMDELGIYAVLKDVQTKVMLILESLDKQKVTYFAQEKESLAEEETRIAEENKSSPLFDGLYSFNLIRYHDDEDWQELGGGYIEINNGVMAVAKEGRTLNTGSTDLYDSFTGQINKKGNIMSSVIINVLFKKTRLFVLDLNGTIDSPLKGKWDNHYEVVLKLGKKE